MANESNFYSSMNNAAPDPGPVKTPGDMDEAAQRMFGGTAHKGAVLHDPAGHLTQPAEQVEHANESWRRALTETQVSDMDGRALTTLARQYLTKPPTAAEKAEWDKETGTNLTHRYGSAEARTRLESAKALMSRAPALRGMLEKAQLLGHPRVVTMFVEKAHSMKLAGKL